MEVITDEQLVRMNTIVCTCRDTNLTPSPGIISSTALLAVY